MRPTDHPADLRTVLLETYAANDPMNQLMLANLNPKAWRDAIFAHLHNNRLVWLKNSAPHLKCPAVLDPYTCTMKQASTAHKKSARNVSGC